MTVNDKPELAHNDHIKACAKEQSCSICKEFLGRV